MYICEIMYFVICKIMYFVSVLYDCFTMYVYLGVCTTLCIHPPQHHVCFYVYCIISSVLIQCKFMKNKIYVMLCYVQYWMQIPFIHVY